MDLIYEHYTLDLKESPGYVEDKDEEKYYDPEFDEVWEEQESSEETGIGDIDFIDENPFSNDFEGKDYLPKSTENRYEDDEWEEV